MSACQETAGLLFRRPCPNPASHACGQCNKPICSACARSLPGSAPLCITCARNDPRSQDQRHQGTDPYFYWYRPSDQPWVDDYSAEDYALFDNPADEDFSLDRNTPKKGGWDGS